MVTKGTVAQFKLLLFCLIRTVPLLLNIQRYFCMVYEYTEKADLSKRYWNPTKKLGVTTHFSDINVKQQ